MKMYYGKNYVQKYKPKFTVWLINLPVSYFYFFFFVGAVAPRGARTSSFLKFLDHTQRRTTVGRAPLDE